MKTRAQIYGKEAAGLLRDITNYHCIHHYQLLQMYPGRENKTENLLQHLVRQGRVFYDADTDCYYDTSDRNTDPEMLSALWVLTDFIDRVEYHSAGEAPIQVVFFAEGEVYEVIYAPADREALICQMLPQKEEQIGRRLVIIESQDQMETLRIPGTAAFCMVEPDGHAIQYYTKRE